jgi:Ni,Fe-hydrogenase III large subunit/Ni,Fe-hydrogenase III component G
MSRKLARYQLQALCQPPGIELHRPGRSQMQFMIMDAADLIPLVRKLIAERYALVTAFVNDENELEDRCFKLYTVFSHAQEDLFVILEACLPANSGLYPSLSPVLPAFIPFEMEIADLFGLFPDHWGRAEKQYALLHECYGADFYPLRRNAVIHRKQDVLQPSGTDHLDPKLLPLEGETLIPVGPIHAGIIEPGRFIFRVSGETIEELDIRLGYTHKGIEHLFQSHYSLQEGWRLAERISGDSAFSHCLAYCKAVESLARQPVETEASLLRAIFLELERLANHLGDCSALAQDVSLDFIAAELAVNREQVMRLQERLTGSRFLRGVNRPGGVILPAPLDVRDLQQTLTTTRGRFLDLAYLLACSNDFRERTIGIGVLSPTTAEHLSVTGLAGRASGLERDYRLQHPFGPYCSPAVNKLIREAGKDETLDPIFHHPLTGDVYSRFVMRVREVNLSVRLINHFLSLWEKDTARTDFLPRIDLSASPAYEFGLGYVEGWRGDIIYWVMKDKFERIYRCKVRDPSTLNWPGLKAAVNPHLEEEQVVETSLVDFPVINKSFNLSYSGNDL